MTNLEYKDLIKKSLPNKYITVDVIDINHKPHPYTIGPKHIHYASQHHSAYITEETLKHVPCAHPNCSVSYADHTSDKVCSIKLSQNITNKRMNYILKKMIDKLPEVFKSGGVDGFIFIKGEGIITE